MSGHQLPFVACLVPVADPCSFDSMCHLGVTDEFHFQPQKTLSGLLLGP
jgi:hypothetical protein